MLVFIRHIGANLAYVVPIDPVDPGFGVPGLGGGGVDPGFGIPEGGHPDNALPGRDHIWWGGRHPSRPVDPGYGRPIFHPGHPEHGLPSAPGLPDNTLPSQPPPQIKPGYLLVLARGTDGKWHYAALAPGSAPPKPLPEPLPPDAGTKPVDPDAPVAGTPLPPIAAPKT